METNKQPTEVNDDDEEEDEDERDSRDIRSRTAKRGSSLLLEQKLNNNKGKRKVFDLFNRYIYRERDTDI